jgi:Transposase DDE domain
MDEPQFKQNVSERMWKMEGLFAEAKQNDCLARAKYRGRTKVQIQAYLIAIVQNLKRLLFPLYCWLVAYLRRSTAQNQACIASRAN